MFNCVFRVKEDPLDLKVKKASQVFKEHLVREVLLALKVPKVARAILASQDQTVNLASRDRKENRARMVWTAKRARLVFQEKLVLRVKWVCQAHPVNLDQRDLPAFKATRANLETRVTLASKAYLDLKVRQEIRVFTDPKDLLDFVDHRDPRYITI